MKIIKLLLALTLAWPLIGCQGKLVPVPPFEVQIDLDKRTGKELRDRKETIHISGIFSTNSAGFKENNKALGYVFGSFEEHVPVSC